MQTIPPGGAFDASTPRDAPDRSRDAAAADAGAVPKGGLDAHAADDAASGDDHPMMRDAMATTADAHVDAVPEAGASGDASCAVSDAGCGECRVPEDCPELGEVCKVRTCTSGRCGVGPMPDGIGCDDGNACTTEDACRAGACVGGARVLCLASDACHRGACDPLTGACTNAPQQDGFACDDGDTGACTHGDACQSGVCTAGAAVTCSNGASCHDGSCVAARCSGEVGLAGPPPLQVSTYPYAVVIADFDGDGEQDIATANSASADVSVLLARGNGRFLPPAQYAVGDTPLAILAEDLDADGDVDLAVVDKDSNDISLLFNKGTGSFAAAVKLAAGTAPSRIAAGDLSGDGHPDLVVVTASDEALIEFVNDGHGAFTRASIPIDSAVGAVEIAEINGDGALDLVIAREDPSDPQFQGFVNVLLNRSDGTFEATLSRHVGWGPWAIAIADLDKDGDKDVAVTDGSIHSMQVFFNLGVGMLSEGAGYQLLYADNTVDIESADFDGDGFIDLVVIKNDNGRDAGSANVLRNKGDGSFEPEVVYAFGFDPVDAAVGDLNDDGAPDLISAGNVGGDVQILLNAGGGSLVASAPFGKDFQASRLLAFDVDGDGDVDLVATAQIGSGFTIAKNRGNATFEPAIYDSADVNGELAVADFNGDGKLDIAVADGALSILYNQGGAFADPVQRAVDAAPGVLAAADFDRDGRVDLAVCELSSGKPIVAFLYAQGDSFVRAGSYAIGLADSLVATRLNADDWPDLLIASDGAVRSLINQGNGTFAASNSIAAVPHMVVADLDGDGLSDFATADSAGKVVRIFSGRGDGTFVAKKEYAIEPGPTAIGSADLDGDGRVDLILTLANSEQFAVMFNGGSASFESPLPYPSSHVPDEIDTADLNGDGRPDVITTSTHDHGLTVHLNVCLQ